MGILVVVIAIIIIAVWCTNRIRFPVVVPLSLRNQQRREEALYGKDMRHFILDSLPVIKYNAKLQSNDRRASKVHNPARRVYPLTDEAELTARGEKSQNICIKGALAHRRESMNREPYNETILTSGKGEFQNEDCFGSSDSELACSVCTEDFIENDSVRILPCGHIYHRRCIDPWLLRFGGTCPLW